MTTLLETTNSKRFKEMTERTTESQSEILAKDIIKFHSHSDGTPIEERIHQELDNFQIRGSLSITTELVENEIRSGHRVLYEKESLSKHIEFIGYDYKVQTWLKFAYFTNFNNKI